MVCFLFVFLQQTFKLNKNNLSGSLPSDLSQLDQMIILEVQDNQLTGSIPEEFFSWMFTKQEDPAAVAFVNLTNNAFSGMLPPEICPLLRDNNDDDPSNSTSLFYYLDCSENLCGCSCNCAI